MTPSTDTQLHTRMLEITFTFGAVLNPSDRIRPRSCYGICARG